MLSIDYMGVTSSEHTSTRPSEISGGTLIIGDSTEKAERYAEAYDFDTLYTYCRGKETSLHGYRVQTILVTPGTHLEKEQELMLRARLTRGGRIFNMNTGTVYNQSFR